MLVSWGAAGSSPPLDHAVVDDDLAVASLGQCRSRLLFHGNSFSPSTRSRHPADLLRSTGGCMKVSIFNVSCDPVVKSFLLSLESLLTGVRLSQSLFHDRSTLLCTVSLLSHWCLHLLASCTSNCVSVLDNICLDELGPPRHKSSVCGRYLGGRHMITTLLVKSDSDICGPGPCVDVLLVPVIGIVAALWDHMHWRALLSAFERTCTVHARPSL